MTTFAHQIQWNIGGKCNESKSLSRILFSSSSSHLKDKPPAHGCAYQEAQNIIFSTLTCPAGSLLFRQHQMRSPHSFSSELKEMESRERSQFSGAGTKMQSTDGVKGLGVRMLKVDFCTEVGTAALLCLQAPHGCSHNSIQSSELSYTPTPKAV